VGGAWRGGAGGAAGEVEIEAGALAGSGAQVPSNPAVGGAFYSPWFGIETSGACGGAGEWEEAGAGLGRDLWGVWGVAQTT
jgi:hypothetical protein